MKPPSRQRTQYSAATGMSSIQFHLQQVVQKVTSLTGRLIPPPSRAMSRGFSRSQKRDTIANTMASQFHDGNPEPEARVSSDHTQYTVFLE